MEGIDQVNITPASTNVLRQNGSEDYIIDPANKEDVAKLVGCEKSLTDRAEDPFSRSDNNSLDNQKNRKKLNKMVIVELNKMVTHFYNLSAFILILNKM
jgi:hypothetical protein